MTTKLALPFKNKWTRAATLLGAVSLAIWSFLESPYRVVYVYTPSVPRGFYFVEKDVSLKDFQLGDYIAFKYKTPDWAKGRYHFPDGEVFVKYVGALPGDRLAIVGGEITSCSQSTVSCRNLGKPLATDTKGRPMPTPNWREKTVPDGQFYAYSTDLANSYDSRYYGLIPADRLYGKATPIITSSRKRPLENNTFATRIPDFKIHRSQDQTPLTAPYPLQDHTSFAE